MSTIWYSNVTREIAIRLKRNLRLPIICLEALESINQESLLDK